MKNAPPTPHYPIGTRIAEGYAMDLNREAAEGRPALFGARAREHDRPLGEPFLLRADVLVAVVGVIAIYAAYRWQSHGLDWALGKDWLLRHLRLLP